MYFILFYISPLAHPNLTDTSAKIAIGTQLLGSGLGTYAQAFGNLRHSVKWASPDIV